MQRHPPKMSTTVTDTSTAVTGLARRSMKMGRACEEVVGASVSSGAIW
jgi:hypothetical protein